MTWAVGQRITGLLLNALSVIQNSMELQISSSQALTTATWTVATLTAAPVVSSGTNLAGGTTGITVTTAGRYLCTGIASFSAGSATTRRAVGVSSASGGAPGAFSNVVVAGFAATAHSVFFTKELSFNAGDVISLWVFQDSGASLNVGTRALTVRQVG